MNKLSYKDRAKQLLEFNIDYDGNLGFTDLDSLIEYKDKAYFFIEAKYNNTPMKDGQRLALKRLVDDTTKAGKKSIAIVVDHDVWDCSKSVMMADCVPREFYFGGFKKWRKLESETTLEQIIKGFIKKQTAS